MNSLQTLQGLQETDTMSNDTRTQVIAQFEAQRDELQAAQIRLANVLLGQGYIVVCEGLALSFDVTNGQATKPTVTRSYMATRFTQRDAQAVAENVTNGKGTKGTAVHVAEALRQEIAQVEALIATLRNIKG